MEQFSIWFNLLLVLVIFGKSVNAAKERSARGNLIAFNTIGHDVALGLDFEMPFVRVPIGRHLDKNGQQRAMMTINTGAIITTTLLAGGGLLVGYLLRSLGIQGTGINRHYESPTSVTSQHRSDNKTARQLNDGDAEIFVKTLQALKIVYKNETGARVEITLPQLYEHLEQSFAERNIDMQSCVWQSLCTLVQQSQMAMRSGRANAVQKIIDGLTQMPWLISAVRNTAMGEVLQAASNGIIGAGVDDCVAQYASSCQLEEPMQKITQLLHTYVQFT